MSLLTVVAVGHPAQSQVDPKASLIITGSLKALGGIAIQDVVLAGTANRTPSANHDSINVTLKAMASGSQQVSYDLKEGPIVETRILDGSGKWEGNWIEPTGVRHGLASHNMMTEAAWFLPNLALQRALTPTSTALVAYVGRVTFQGTSVEHLRFIANPSAVPPSQTWSQSDLYLDSESLLPVAMTYNEHPDNNVRLDIPVTVVYANYTMLSGLIVPTHVQQMRNNALFIDLQIQTVQLNTGASVSLPQ